MERKSGMYSLPWAIKTLRLDIKLPKLFTQHNYAHSFALTQHTHGRIHVQNQPHVICINRNKIVYIHRIPVRRANI